jgi:hypothetical protein
LVTHAKSFTGFNGILSPNTTAEELTCVIQFVSHPRSLFKNKYLRNLDAQVPVHCGIRIVMSDGSVYSTGFGSTSQEDKYNGSKRKYLGSINGQPTVFDYEEFRPHEGRIVTNIPVGDKRAENIINQLNAYRAGTIRFNILKQNCMRLGTNVMSMAGVDLDIHQTFGTMLYRGLPNLETIPVVGKPAKSLQGRVKRISKVISSKIPRAVKQVFHSLGNMLLFIPRKFGTILLNLLVLAMGGLVASPQRKNPGLDKKDDLEEFESLDSFNKLFDGLLDETASDIQHSAIFINWQLQQASTDVFKYSGQPNMNVVPPNTEEAIADSEKRKAELWKVYQHSTPMAAA